MMANGNEGLQTATNDGGCQVEKERMQQMHYKYLSTLQDMSRELPGMYQQRLPYDLLSGLANVLLDGTVFSIVSSLQEVQQLEEKNLSNERLQRIRDSRAGKSELLKKHREKLQSVAEQPQNIHYVQQQCAQQLQEFDLRWEEECKTADMRIVLSIDQKVMDQQNLLEKAGVPGFYVTNKSSDIRLQMYLLDFIMRLKDIEAS